MLRHLIATIATLLLSLSIGPAASAEEPIAIGKFETIDSKILDEQRTLMVRLPPDYGSSKTDYPVLYLLDSRTHFHHTTGTLGALARLGQIPEMIVIGLVNSDRTRDLTPPWTDEESAKAEEDREQLIAAGGGADQFLRFISDELIPHVENKYRAAPFRVLVGHSFGGLFAVHAFINQPDLFAATLAISPSLWWDAGHAIEQMREFFAARPDMSRHLYLTLGNEGGIMVDPFRQLQSVLRYEAPADLAWHAEVFDHEDHGTMPMPSVYAALRFFFPRWNVPNHLFEDGLKAVDTHYAALSEEYGFKTTTAESMINNMGYRALGTDKAEEAIEIFKANVERFPTSSNVYDSLGEAVEATGRLEEALALYEKAHAMTLESDDQASLSAYQGHIDAVREKIDAR